MITPEIRRVLTLAQLVTVDVVRLGQQDDIKGATLRCCMYAKHIIGEVNEETITDVADTVRFMLQAHISACESGPTFQPKPVADTRGFSSEAPPPAATILRMIPGGRADDASAAPLAPQPSTPENP
ncbi:hypothetical protein ACQVP2_07425 [Methylobacterium aquaticum]|uniref:hypothetical protein n=1 Tax=Methylobacterium aquaticum TaxID=270351 RepID=UPI003D17DB26